MSRQNGFRGALGFGMPERNSPKRKRMVFVQLRLVEYGREASEHVAGLRNALRRRACGIRSTARSTELRKLAWALSRRCTTKQPASILIRL